MERNGTDESHDAVEADRATSPRTLLTVELVPRTCWFSNVRSEVSPEEWDRLREATYRRAGNRCEVCGGRGPRWPVEAHEIWRYNDTARTQTLLGLIALCPACHRVKHIGLAEAKGHGRSAIKHLARVNGWSVEDAEAYVEVQFEIWSRRSHHDWTLDISWLEQFGIDTSRHARRSGGHSG